MKQRIPLVLVATLLIGFVVWKGQQVRLDVLTQTRAPLPVATASASPPGAASQSSPVSSAIRTRQARPERPTLDALADDFKSRFGPSLELTVGVAGCLVSVKGSPQKAVAADGKFTPTDTSQTLARALEVVRAASEFLCIDSGWPLSDPVLSNSPYSVQASFHETRDGLPVLPFGAVSITLGPKGELLRLDSSYSGGGSIANERKLTADEARGKVEAALPSDVDYSGKALEGRPIFWVASRTESGAATIVHAYEFYSHGKQVIVDAGNGAILLKRERRVE